MKDILLLQGPVKYIQRESFFVKANKTRNRDWLFNVDKPFTNFYFLSLSRNFCNGNSCNVFIEQGKNFSMVLLREFNLSGRGGRFKGIES